jgi:CubicO group peptidase (beta-lactamase class C family)
VPARCWPHLRQVRATPTPGHGGYTAFAFDVAERMGHSSGYSENLIRMKTYFHASLFAFGLACSTFADKVDDAALRSLAERQVPGASIAIIRSGTVSARTYGTLEKGGSVKVNPDTLFQAASISKPLTAMATLRLVQEGRLSLDQDINELLSGWKLPQGSFHARVTIRMILSHTAGITVSGVEGYEMGEPLPNLIQILNGVPPAKNPAIVVDTEPGTKYRYSGGGYIVLQQLLSEKSGVPFSEFMNKTILSPLHMARSTYEQPLSTNWVGNAATGYDRKGNPVKGRWHIYPELAPAGLWTTPTDLARFALEVGASLEGKSDRILKPEMARLMVTPVLGPHGLGLEAHNQGKAFRFRHDGGNKGYRCRLLFYPNLGEGVVIMTNGGRGDEVIVDVMQALRAEYTWPQ